MKAKHMVFLAASLTVALAATTVVSAPRMARGNAMLLPTGAELGLSADHAKQWDELRAETLALRQVGREDKQSTFSELRTLLGQSDPDLRAFSDASQIKLDAQMAEARDLRDRQLDLYESLSPEEQAQVRAAMAKRLDRLGEQRKRFGGFFSPQQ